MKDMKATLDDVDNLVGRRVFIRVDYNVPIDSKGRITDDNRIRQSLETIKYCISRNAKIILASHFGRPEGREEKYSLEPVAVHLRKLLPKTTIYFASDCVGDVVENQSRILKNGEILLLENTRFYKEEEENDENFSKWLSRLGDIFVNDAFGAAHRAHASTVGITKYLPAVAGFLIEKELRFLSAVTVNPVRPLTIICGGAKVDDKRPIIESLIDKADNILIGGKIAQAWKLDKPCKANIVVARDAEFDINEETIKEFTEIIDQSGTIFWNGPLGMFENPKYAKGTRAIAEAVSKSHAVSIVGGGDTASAIAGYEFNHISTGGGASLEFVQGKELPGISCLLTVTEFNRIEKERGL